MDRITGPPRGRPPPLRVGWVYRPASGIWGREPVGTNRNPAPGRRSRHCGAKDDLFLFDLLLFHLSAGATASTGKEEAPTTILRTNLYSKREGGSRGLCASHVLAAEACRLFLNSLTAGVRKLCDNASFNWGSGIHEKERV